MARRGCSCRCTCPAITTGQFKFTVTLAHPIPEVVDYGTKLIQHDAVTWEVKCVGIYPHASYENDVQTPLATTSTTVVETIPPYQKFCQPGVRFDRGG